MENLAPESSSRAASRASSPIPSRSGSPEPTISPPRTLTPKPAEENKISGMKAKFMKSANALKMRPQAKSASAIINEAAAAEPVDVSKLIDRAGLQQLQVAAPLQPIDLDDPSDDPSLSEDASQSTSKPAARKQRASVYDTKSDGKVKHRMLRRSDNRYKEIKRQLARRARARKEDTSGVQE